MNDSIQSLTDFAKSLKSFKSFIQVEYIQLNYCFRKFGLCETTLTKTSIFSKEGIGFDLKLLSFYSKDSYQVVFSYNNPSNDNETNTSDSLAPIIKRLLLHTSNAIEFAFTKIILKASKYVILNIKKSNVVIVSQFDKGTKTSIIKLFLLHISTAYSNFLTSKADLSNRNKCQSVNKIFELFFFHPIAKHFQSTANSLFKHKDMHFPNLDYKNLYLVDLSSNEVIFNWNSVNKAFEKSIETNNELLWVEFLFHCHNLKADYMKSNGNQFDSIDYCKFFVKVAYSASYPKSIFVIKFLPILKGIGLIHSYAQRKLSNSDEGRYQYKEFDIQYGNEMNKESGQIEYVYKEPHRLKEIELFFIEFLMSCSISFGFFNYPKYESKYFDMNIMKIIDNALTHESSDKIIISRITNSLYDEYLRIKARPNKESVNNSYLHNGINQVILEEENNREENESSIQKPNNNQWNLLSKENESLSLFQIKTAFYYKEVFTVLNPELRPEDMTILLSKAGDKSSLMDLNRSELIQQLMNNEDMSLLTKCNRNLNEPYQIDQSLFNINITAIGTKKKEDSFTQHKECKSETFPIKKKACDKLNKTSMANGKEDIMLDFSNQSYSSLNMSHSNINNNPKDSDRDDNDTDRKSIENNNNNSNNILFPPQGTNQTLPTNKPMLSTTGNKL